MGKRHYDLDENGIIKSSYARPQPGLLLSYLDEAPDDNYKWTGSEWIENNGNYYYLDEEGVPIGFFRLQPEGGNFPYLENPVDDFRKWDGTVWVENVPKYLNYKIDQARTLATTRWIDSTKAITAIQANYNVFKSANYNSMAEVDAAFNDFIQFMEI